MWHKLAWLAAAGAVGSLCRYGLAGLVHRITGGSFPWGTAVVNALGCFLFGLVWALAEQRMLISVQVRLIVLTGFMGAFTTFSTFAFESVQMGREGQWFPALANIAGQNIAGLLLLWLGMALGRTA